MSKTVRIVNLVQPVIFRADRPSAAFDDARHAVPMDLDLSHNVTEGVDRAIFEYWSQRTAGVRWDQFGDTVILTADDGAGGSPSDRLERDRIKLERDRIQFARDERAAFNREMRQVHGRR